MGAAMIWLRDAGGWELAMPAPTLPAASPKYAQCGDLPHPLRPEPNCGGSPLLAGHGELEAQTRAVGARQLLQGCDPWKGEQGTVWVPQRPPR